MRSITKFAHLMPSTVTVAARTGQDATGKPTYGTPTSYRCHISRRPRMMMNAQGQEIVSSQAIYLASADPILASAQITLSTGDVGSTQDSILHPPISIVDRRFDESGAHYTALMLV